MVLNRPDGALAISAETYTPTFAQDRPFIYVDAAGAHEDYRLIKDSWECYRSSRRAN